MKIREGTIFILSLVLLGGGSPLGAWTEFGVGATGADSVCTDNNLRNRQFYTNLWCDQSGDFMMVYWFGANVPRILKTTNNGSSWSTETNPFPGPRYSLNGWCYGDSVFIVSTTMSTSASTPTTVSLYRNSSLVLTDSLKSGADSGSGGNSRPAVAQVDNKLLVLSRVSSGHQFLWVSNGPLGNATVWTAKDTLVSTVLPNGQRFPLGNGLGVYQAIDYAVLWGDTVGSGYDTLTNNVNEPIGAGSVEYDTYEWSPWRGNPAEDSLLLLFQRSDGSIWGIVYRGSNLGSGSGTLSKLDSIQIESAAMLNPNVTFPYTLGCPTACWIGEEVYVCYKYWADTTLTTQASIVYRKLSGPPLAVSARTTIRAADGVKVTALKGAAWTPNLSGTARIWLAFTNNNTATANRDSLYVGFEELNLGTVTTYPARRRTAIILGGRRTMITRMLLALVVMSHAAAFGFGIVNNSGSSTEDSLCLPVLSLDSLGRPAGADSFFVMVFKSHANNVLFADSGTAAMTGLDTVRVGGLTYYYFHRAVADIDGAGAVGQYGIVITAKKLSTSLSTPNRYSFQIIAGDLSPKLDSIGLAALHSGRALDSLALLIDSLQAVLDTLQDGANGPLVTMKVAGAGAISANSFTNNSINSDVLAGTAASEIADSVLNDSLKYRGSGASCSGSGPYAVTIRLTDTVSSWAVPGADLAVRNLTQTALIALAGSDLQGNARVNLDTGTYLVTASAPGYIFRPFDTIIVTGAGTFALNGYRFDPGNPASPGLCRVYGYLYSVAGEPEAGATVSISLAAGAVRSSGLVVSPFLVTTRTNTLGYFALDIIPSDALTPSGTKYDIAITRQDGIVLRQRLKVPAVPAWQLTW